MSPQLGLELQTGAYNRILTYVLKKGGGDMSAQHANRRIIPEKLCLRLQSKFEL